MSGSVLYEEQESVAIIAINRPDRLNTLTQEVIQNVAASIDRATQAENVAAIVLRGEGRNISAGYDLDDFLDNGDVVDSEIWDPVRDYQSMSANVRSFMKIWECPKPVIAEISGWAIGGATDLLLCADLLFMANDAQIGYAPSRIYGTPTTMLWVYRIGLEHAKQFLLTGRPIDAETALRIGLVSQVCDPQKLSSTALDEARRFANIPANQLALNKLLINQAFENMGLRTSQMLGTFFDGIARHTPEAQRWAAGITDGSLRDVVRERDRPWGDYGEGGS
ncbi:MAG: crotonase/enoyl-CoA hydratase family protein [Acidimicrobiales bacterium]|nr:crotonase/enoyl-CoA hydratase family protein [Acidimicrobiales bacterium]